MLGKPQKKTQTIISAALTAPMRCLVMCLTFLAAAAGAQSSIVITGLSPNGVLTCSNLVLNSTCRVEWASAPAGPWTNSWSALNNIVVGSNRQFTVPVPMFYRVVMTPPPPPNTNIYTVGWCSFKWPSFINSLPAYTIRTYGSLYIAGLTDVNQLGNDPAVNVVGQLGYGPANTAPAANTNWTWINAAPNPAYEPANTPNVDEYFADLNIPIPGSYSAVYRFSGNGGQTWVYAGTSGSTSGNGLQPLPDAAPVNIAP